MMTRLLLLPRELLLDIIERLEGDNGTLAALCLASRLCDETVRPYLYRSITIGGQYAKNVQVALLLRTLFDRPELAKHTKTLRIDTHIYADRAADVEVPSGATRMRLANGNRLEDACTAHVRSHMRYSAPGCSCMIVHWRPRLRRGAQTAYVGLLLLLLENVTDLGVTIYCDERRRRKSVQPLDRLFGLSVGAWYDESHLEPRPYLPVVPSTRHITRLQISGANLALLCLGFEALEILEIDFVQSREDNKYIHTGWTNQKTKFRAGCLPRVRTMNLVVAWEEQHTDCVAALFGKLYFPCLQELVFVLGRSPIPGTYLRLGTLDVFTNRLGSVTETLQSLSLRINPDHDMFDINAMNRMAPIRVHGPLRHLSNLLTLCVPAAALVDCHLHVHSEPLVEFLTPSDLPPLLEHLRIFYPNHQTLQWLDELFNMASFERYTLQTVTLTCAWNWGKPPSWFERRRKELDIFPVQVIIDVLPGQIMPVGFIDREVSGMWDAQEPDDSWMAGLFGNYDPALV